MEHKHRTWLCSVLFLDIVGYSKLSVERQMGVREHFYGLVDEALTNLSRDECITLDAGDGMAICYLGDPEEILLVAISLRDVFRNQDRVGTPYQVRLGINLGPVKIVELQGERRVIGDAINVAQRVMDFAKPNQLLVSRSYYDVVSCVSEAYPTMFNYLGRHADKHVRQHAVYEVVPEGGTGAETLADSQAPANEASSAPNPAASDAAAFDDLQLHHVANQLATYIGPLALILVKKAAKEAQSLDDLYRALAEDVPTEEQKRRFLDSRHTLH